MKSIYIKWIMGLTLSTLLFSACTDNYLDLTPPDKMSPEAFFVSEENAIIAVNGLYNANLELYQGREHALDYDCMSDNMYNLSRYMNTQEMGQNTHSSQSAYPLAKWKKNYKGISRANMILKYLDNCYSVGKPSSRKERLRGESYFFRAYFYADLIDFFGDVPLDLDPKDVTSMSPRVAREIILEQIIEDLDSAIVRLPVRYESADMGRATKGAALAVKGKALLYNHRYEDAAKALKKVIDLRTEEGAPAYDIYPHYRELFLPQHKNNPETVFDVQYVKGKFTQGLSHNMYVYVVLWSSFCPLVQLVDEYYTINGLPIDKDPIYNSSKPFENRDPRLTASIITPRSLTGRLDSKGNPAIFIPSTSQPTSMKIRKWNDYTESENNNSDHNIVLIRFADVLLMYAEAAVMTNTFNEADVRDAVNRVRQRPAVMMPKVEDVEGTGLSKEEWTDIIRHERRVEFAFEGTRLSDIRRWGIAEDVMVDAMGYDPAFAKLNPPQYKEVVVDKRSFNPNRSYLWPIPQTEVNSNTAIGQANQNPGY